MLRVSVQNFTQLGGRADFLRPFISSRVAALIRYREGSDSECATHFVQISEIVGR
jgi:hypothetical protein